MTFGAHAIAHGDVLAALRELPANSFDALLCDPPYGISFMGKSWDYDVPSVEVWSEALRVLKPGAALLSFGGTRTYHRIAVAIEDAGFELRDCLMWLYGKGFPKSHDVSKALDKAAGATREVIGAGQYASRRVSGAGGLTTGAFEHSGHSITAPATDLARTWDGYGTTLKPAWEPIILARKPLDGTIAANVARWGTGGLAIDACRIDRDEDDTSGWSKTGSHAGPNLAMSGGNTERAPKADAEGRWPANLVLDEDAATHVGDAARFFYCTKVSTRERELGCEALALKSAGECTDREDGQAGLSSPRAGAGRTGGARNHHPTLKPIALTSWLARLVKPPTPGAALLVPYSGAGSEMIGALLAGWPLVFGIEGEAAYVEIAHARIAAWGAKEAA